MKYITISDLSDTIRKNFHKIPHDIDFVVGVPRSGMLCATIISEFLNVPLTDCDSFISGVKPGGGGRLVFHTRRKSIKTKENVLVIDDTINSGECMSKTKKKLELLKEKYNFIYAVVYLEGDSSNLIDFYLEDVRKYTNNQTEIVLYEWNVFQHYDALMSRCIYDIDGVLCVNPPDERDEKEYLEHIKNATPLFIPKTNIGELLTYRLSKNRSITEDWLNRNGVKYGKLSMFKATTWDERNRSNISPEVFKGEYYKEQVWAKLFVESDDYQARRIFEISGKPVLCVETNKLYQKQ